MSIKILHPREDLPARARSLEKISFGELPNLPEDIRTTWIEGRLAENPITFFHDLVIASEFKVNPFAELIQKSQRFSSLQKPTENILRIIPLSEATPEEVEILKEGFYAENIHTRPIASLESAKKVEGLKEQIELNPGLNMFLKKVIEISKNIQDEKSFNIFNQHLEFVLMTYLHQTGQYHIRHESFVTDYFRANYSKQYNNSKLWLGSLNPFCECISLFQVPDFIGSQIADLAGQDRSNWHPLVWLSKLNQRQLEELQHIPNFGLDMEGEWLDHSIVEPPKGFTIGYDMGQGSIHEIRRQASAISTVPENLADLYDLWYWVKRSGFIGGSIHFHFDTMPNHHNAISNIARSMKYPKGIKSENRLTSDVWEFRFNLPGRKKSKYNPDVPFNSKDLNLFPMIYAFNEIADGTKRIPKVGISWFDLQMLEEPVKIISILDAISSLQAAWVYREGFAIGDLAKVGINTLTQLDESAQVAFVSREGFAIEDLAKVGINTLTQLDESAQAAFVSRKGFAIGDLTKVGINSLTQLHESAQVAFVSRKGFVIEDLAKVRINSLTQLHESAQAAFVSRSGFVIGDLAKVRINSLTHLHAYARAAFVSRDGFAIEDLVKVGVNTLTQLDAYTQATFVYRNEFVIDDLSKVGINSLTQLDAHAQATFISRKEFVIEDLARIGINDLTQLNESAQAAFISRNGFVIGDLAKVGVKDFTRLHIYAQIAFIYRNGFVIGDFAKVGVEDLTRLPRYVLVVLNSYL